MFHIAYGLAKQAETLQQWKEQSQTAAMQLMIIQNSQYNETSILNNIHLLKSLFAVMAAFLEGNSPTKEILDTSPVIDLWSFSTRQSPCLEGTLHHHPMLGNLVPNGTTSQRWLLNKAEAWARTLSRFYRLGTHTNR